MPLTFDLLRENNWINNSMLNRFVLGIFLGFGLIAPFVLYAQEAADPSQNLTSRYITDDLYTYVHAGPGRNYRILGSVVAGSEVKVVSKDEASGFVEIIDDKDRQGWVDGRFLVDQSSVRNQLPSLQARLTSANDQIKQLLEENERLSEQLASVTSVQSNQDSQLAELQQTNTELTQKLAAKGRTEEQDWMLKGGALALASVLLGVILSLVLKGRRRRDGWM